MRNGVQTMVVLCVLTLGLVGCGTTSSGVLSTKPEAWVFQYSPRMFWTPMPANAGLWYFDFPDSPGSVHYLVTSYSSATRPQSISMTFHMETGGPVVFHGNLSPDNDCIAPARVRLYFQKTDDDWVSDGNRWWSNPVSAELDTSGASDVTLSVPLTPDKWSTVSGEFGNQDETTQAWFFHALDKVGKVGMTFGGGCFFGHGVNISGGSARFVLTDFNIS
jgi:hypothetical protein